MVTRKKYNIIKREMIVCIAFIFAILFMAFLNGYNYSSYADFSPLNGAFQNYNPVRRLLDGQTPFVDFEVYLGLGHLFTGSIVTGILGGTFQASLYAFRILSFLAFEITFYIIARSILNNQASARRITLLISALNLIEFKNILPIDISIYFSDSLNAALSITRDPGNSARILRSTICVLAPASIFLINQLIKKIAEKGISTLVTNYFRAFAIGGVCALSVLWSNDYGISSCIIILGIATLFSLKTSNKQMKKFFMDVICMISGFIGVGLLVLIIITRGCPSAYINMTMQVSQYQSWYAVHTPSGKAYFLWDLVLMEPYAFIAVGIIIVYSYCLFRGEITEKKLKRFGIPLSVLLTGYFAVHLYRFSDGGGTEYFLILLFSIIIAEVVRGLESLVLESSFQSVAAKAKIGMSVMLFAVLISQTGKYIISNLNSKTGIYQTGIYVEGLDGYLTRLGDAVNSTEEKINESTVFNTYASAVETVTNQFQPSGVDYIIHVLGDKHRENYVDAFYEAKSDYAGLIREDYSAWEGYIRGSNWFFYREMLNNYVISFSNDYQNYYSRSSSAQKSQIECSTVVTQLSADKVRITLTYPSETYNGLADVKLNYNISKTLSWKNIFCFRQIGLVHDMNTPEGANDYYDIPIPDSGEIYIPIIIKNGVGTIEICSYPQEYTAFHIEEISCEGIFLNALDIANVISVQNFNENTSILAVEGDWITGYSKIVQIQHENYKVNVVDMYVEGNTTYFVIESQTEFLCSLDEMSSVKLCMLYN